jgi:hypothetical protein
MLRVAFTYCLLVVALASPVRAADAAAPEALAEPLVWHRTANRVDADFRNWPLERILKTIAAKARWEVFVEPGLDRSLSARFSGLTQGEALRRFFGPLNFAVVPTAAGPVRLYVFRSSLASATETIEAPAEPGPAARRSGAIAEELVVILKPGAEETIEELAERLGAKIVGRDDERGFYRLRFKDGAAAAMARVELDAAPGVGVESNYWVGRPDSPGFLGVGGTPFLNVKPSLDGERVLVGVVDTAVQAEGSGLKEFIVKSIAVAGPASTPADQPTHGTLMATRLVAAAAAASGGDSVPVGLVTADVFGPHGSTSTFDLVQGLYAVAREGVPVINLSLAGNDESPLLRHTIAQLSRQGIVILAAAGIEPVTLPTYPAAQPEVIAVTAQNSRGAIAPYANRGAFVDVAAPGSAVVGFAGQPFFTAGTSVATAHASGIAASIAASTGLLGPDLDAAVRDALALRPPGGP